ncbi:MAG: alpha/beta fold hydrolase [Bacteroidetes bacterium]|nr:alpha/beta fold hydrolase [Bacteroidota bacterium]
MNYNADFGTLVVPENRKNKNSRLINLPVVIVKSLNKNPKEPIFLLNGGPGQSNLWKWWFPDSLLNEHDIVMVGYRGVDGSVSLDFPNFFEYFKEKDTLFSENNFQQINKLLTSYLDSLESKKIDYNGYNIYEVANDIDIARKALFYNKINLFSFSFGTMIANVYSLKYADNVNYSIMNCAHPISYLQQSKNIINNKIDKLCNLWTDDSTCCAKSQNISKTINYVVNNIPNEYNNLKIPSDKLQLMIFNSLYSSQGIAMLFNTFVNAEMGDYSGFEYLSKNFDEHFLYKIKLGDCFLKINSLNNGHYLKSKVNNDSTLGRYLSSAENNFWKLLNSDNSKINKVEKFEQENFTKVNTLFISGDIDAVTPAENVKEYLLPYFINGKMIVLKNFTHDDIFVLQQKAYQNLIGKYYLHGIVDTTMYKNTPFNFKLNKSYENMGKMMFK